MPKHAFTRLRLNSTVAGSTCRLPAAAGAALNAAPAAPHHHQTLGASGSSSGQPWLQAPAQVRGITSNCYNGFNWCPATDTGVRSVGCYWRAGWNCVAVQGQQHRTGSSASRSSSNAGS
eukprot:GHRQ01020374.1.p3 GENE.GHRQ01020374.1~~GHRQ01020374.1.p3  ORF type:complete len:119 (+),score=32.85 GHRQ01020374.1:340-696(+)